MRICRAKIAGVGYFIGTSEDTRSCDVYMFASYIYDATRLVNDVQFLDADESPPQSQRQPAPNPHENAVSGTTPSEQESRVREQKAPEQPKESVPVVPSASKLSEKPTTRDQEIPQVENHTPDDRHVDQLDKMLAFSFGSVFVAALLTLAVLVPKPTPTQFFVFRVVLAISAAGIAAMVPGLLSLQVVHPSARAGGAIAVFAVVYLLNPPRLVSGDK